MEKEDKLNTEKKLREIPLHEIESYVKQRKTEIIKTLEPDAVVDYVHSGSNRMEQADNLVTKGLSRKTAEKLAETRYADEIEILVRVKDGKILGAEGFYFSDSKYSEK